MLPSEHLEMGFIEMKPHRHDHYLLVMVCTFSGWVEAFLTGAERASEVAQCLLREIGDSPQIWISYQHWIRQWPSFRS